MSLKTWYIVTAVGAAWFVYHLFFGFIDSASETALVQKCVHERQASDSGDFGNKVYDQNSGRMVIIQPNPQRGCIEELIGSEQTHRQLAFLFTPMYFFAFGIYEFNIRRKNRERARHDELVSSITKQQKMEIILGDVYRDIHNSTIINRSKLESVILNSEHSAPDLGKALGAVAKIVQESNSPDAGEHFNKITEELAKPQPNKSLLRTYWEGLKQILPAVEGVAEAVVVFGKVFGAS